MNTSFVDPLDLAMFDGDTFLFEVYLEDIESFLETEAQKHLGQLKDFREEIKTGKRIVASYEYPPEQQYANIRLEMLDKFANILRKSFFVSLYGFLESRLTAECRARKQARDDILLSLSDITGRGIIKAKTYLVKVLGISFSFDTSAEWQEIREYNRLRNCIVHNEGRLDEGMGSKDADRLRGYVDRKQTLDLRGDEVFLNKDFCKEACHVIQEFLLSLHFSSEA